MANLRLPRLKLKSRNSNIYGENDEEILLYSDDSFKYPREQLSLVIREIKKRFGVGGLAFLYYISKIMGEFAAESFTSDDTSDLSEIVAKILEYSGIGKVEDIVKKNSKMTIVLSKCIEIITEEEGSNHYVFTKGFIEGLVSRIACEKNYVTFTRNKNYLHVDIFFME